MRGPTMQMIADEAGVSRITVWKVLNNRPGVSEALRNQILDTASRMGYQFSDGLNHSIRTDMEENNLTEAGPVISVVVSRPDSSSFWMNIIHEIAKEASKHNCSLLYTYVPCDIPENYVLPAQLTNGAIQGMIILNVYHYELFSMLNHLSIPKVFLDTITNFPIGKVSGDLVLLEGKDAIFNITETIIQQGRKKIGFIGDIHYALTNRLRYEGYVKAMNRHKLSIDPIYCHTGVIGIRTYMEELHSYLSSLKEMPEAFVCVSDFVACCVYQYLSEHGYQIPDDIALSGYDNLPEYMDMNEWLTTVNINTTALGKRLVQQLDYRIQHKTYPLETVFIHPEVIYRKSTELPAD